MEIMTNRFMLREFNQEDELAFLAYHADPRYAQFCFPEELEAEYTRELLHSFIRWGSEQPRCNYQFAIVTYQNRKELIGCCGLRIKGYDAKKAELGIELAPQYWGRYRYAIEIVSSLLEFGFQQLGLQEVNAFSISANSRVVRLAHRYGFVEVRSYVGSDWMEKQGWSQTEWLLTRSRWESILTSLHKDKAAR
jgi:RimJ/RimL family protein N-acetyltransferase